MNTLKPGGVLLSGGLLAFCIAAVNATFLIRTGTSVSHLTGDLSKIALNLSLMNSGHAQEAVNVSLAAAGFLLGAIVSGAVVHHPQVELARPYGQMILIIGSLLLLSEALSNLSPSASIGTGAVACGMQNALATKYRGIILRTTHLTGLLTDLGVALGMKLRGHAIAARSLRIPFFLASSFTAGAFTGALLTADTRLPVIPCVGAAYMIAGAARWVCRYGKKVEGHKV